ncbi:MAG: hypothetical protein QXF76_00075 [Candidatus Anstonellales archaeon]
MKRKDKSIVEEINLPRKISKINEIIQEFAGKKVKKIVLSSTLGKKTLGKLISFIEIEQLAMPKSIASRINLLPLLKTGIEIIIQQNKRGRKSLIGKNKLTMKKALEMFKNNKISRRTYFYWKKKLTMKRF